MDEFKVDQIVDCWTEELGWRPATVVHQFWDSTAYQVAFGDGKLDVFIISNLRSVDTRITQPSITSEEQAS